MSSRLTFLIICLLSGYFLLGPLMKKLFNHPEMHIWHHAFNIPESRQYGVNFGLSLAIWDFLFKTAYVPYDGKDIPLGFPGMEDFPDDLGRQLILWPENRRD